LARRLTPYVKPPLRRLAVHLSDPAVLIVQPKALALVLVMLCSASGLLGCSRQ
jgi:hypothetical protein